MCWVVSYRQGKKLYRAYLKQEMAKYFDEHEMEDAESSS